MALFMLASVVQGQFYHCIEQQQHGKAILAVGDCK